MATASTSAISIADLDKPQKKMAENVIPSCVVSSMSLEHEPDYVLCGDYPQPEHNSLSVTTVLNYCKCKILNPYLRLLSIVGLRPIFSNQMESNLCLQFINHLYSIQLISLLLLGYVLQYMSCFRRDRGFCFKNPSKPYMLQAEAQQIYDKICDAPLLFAFVIPSVLHLVAYIHAVVVMRHSEDDQLPVLMERVFLTSSHTSNGLNSQRKLIRTLWTFVSFTAVWMVLSLGTVTSMMAYGTIQFKWLENAPSSLTLGTKILLVTGTLCHDIVQATIISNYCLQAQLLTTYLQFLQEKLLIHPVQPLEWIRHIETFKKMLGYMNTEVAPSVCLFTFVNIACATSGILWSFEYDNVDTETVPIGGVSTFNVVLWSLLALAPFVQAARLTNECDILRSAGQEVRTRPFVHQDTSHRDLDSILLYTASLKLRAKLFYIPITGTYLCVFFLFVGITVLVLGQCHYFNN